MKKFIVVFMIVVITCVFVACGVDEERKKMETECEALKAENSVLKKEIIDLESTMDAVVKEYEAKKYNPDRLFKLGDKYAKEKNFKKAVLLYTEITKHHPDTKHEEKAKKLITQVKAAVEKIKKQEKRKAFLEKKKKINTATRKLIRKYIRKEKSTDYSDRHSHFNYSDNSFELEMTVTDSGKQYTFLYIKTVSHYRLGVRQYIVEVDGFQYALTPTEPVTLDRFSSGNIYEAHHIPFTVGEEFVVKKIIEGGYAVVKYIGDNGIREHIITNAQKKGLKDMLEAHKAVKEILK